jgi:two-component system, OmpR family, response regulator RegX3
VVPASPQANDQASPPRPGSGAHVLLVEDEQRIAEPFSRALTREGFTTVVARTGGEAASAIAECEPDVVLLDLALPDCDGRELARRVRAISQVPIIMVTARGSETDRVVGLELGADDYVVKPFSVAEVIARIRAVLRRTGARPEDAGRLAAGGVTLETASRRAWRGQRELALTRKEFDLLARLMRWPGRVVTREQLMSDVWDENWFGSTKTLDVHMASLRRKLGEKPGTPSLIQTLRGVGFRFAGERKG